MVFEKRASRESIASPLLPTIRKRASSQAQAAVRNILAAKVRVPLSSSDKENTDGVGSSSSSHSSRKHNQMNVSDEELKALVNKINSTLASLELTVQINNRRINSIEENADGHARVFNVILERLEHMNAALTQLTRADARNVNFSQEMIEDVRDHLGSELSNVSFVSSIILLNNFPLMDKIAFEWIHMFLNTFSGSSRLQSLERAVQSEQHQPIWN